MFSEATTTVLEVSQLPQENNCVGVSFLKSCRSAGLLHVCFSLYLIIHVMNVFFLMLSFAYIFLCPFTLLHLLRTISSLWTTKKKKCRPGWIWHITTCCFMEGCNFIKKEALAKMFSCEFCKISRNNFFNRTYIRATVFRLSFVNPRRKSLKELV